MRSRPSQRIRFLPDRFRVAAAVLVGRRVSVDREGEQPKAGRVDPDVIEHDHERRRPPADPPRLRPGGRQRASPYRSPCRHELRQRRTGEDTRSVTDQRNGETATSPSVIARRRRTASATPIGRRAPCRRPDRRCGRGRTATDRAADHGARDANQRVRRDGQRGQERPRGTSRLVHDSDVAGTKFDFVVNLQAARATRESAEEAARFAFAPCRYSCSCFAAIPLRPLRPR